MKNGGKTSKLLSFFHYVLKLMSSPPLHRDFFCAYGLELAFICEVPQSLSCWDERKNFELRKNFPRAF
jgi:hypothetical protein